MLSQSAHFSTQLAILHQPAGSHRVLTKVNLLLEAWIFADCITKKIEIFKYTPENWSEEVLSHDLGLLREDEQQQQVEGSIWETSWVYRS